MLFHVSLSPVPGFAEQDSDSMRNLLGLPNLSGQGSYGFTAEASGKPARNARIVGMHL